ncbi:hypothetical protein ABK040_004666 [Willaertia magna]
MIRNYVFEYSDKTKSFLLNNFNENQTNFIDYKEVNKVLCEYPNLFYITKNNEVYRIEPEGNKTYLKDNVISITSSYGQCNFLTNNQVILKNTPLDLPQLDKDDKCINIASTGSSNCCFLLTEKGKVYIYGKNDYGILGCKNLTANQRINNFTKHTELEENIKSKIIDIKCGYNFCVIKCEDGNCYGSGYNYYLDMGVVGKYTLNEFTLLKDKVKQYGCGHFSCAFLTFEGDIYVCGKESDGQFGNNFPLNGALV